MLSGESIRFGIPDVSSGGGLSSRAAGGPLDEFPEGGSFGVLGYCLAQKGDNTGLDPNTGTDSWEAKAPRSTPHLFYKTEVEYNGSACYYTGMQQRWYEPRDYLYSFSLTIRMRADISPLPRDCGGNGRPHADVLHAFRGR